MLIDFLLAVVGRGFRAALVCTSDRIGLEIDPDMMTF